MGRAHDITSAVRNEAADYGRGQGRALKKSGRWFLLCFAAFLLVAVFQGVLGNLVLGGIFGVAGLILLFVAFWKFADAGGDTIGMGAGAGFD